MICTTRNVVSSLVGVALLAGASQAATSWTAPAGSTATFDYSLGATENGLFTDTSPVVGGDTFLFFPNNLSIETPSTFNNSDTLSFVATAKPGLELNRISAGLSGDWSLLGEVFVNVSGLLSVKNLFTNEVLTQALTFTPTFPTYAEDGTFTGFAEIELPEGWTKAEVSLSGDLSANSQYSDGFLASMQIKGANIGIQTVQAAPVPLPGALAAAPFAMGIAWYARRRMSK